MGNLDIYNSVASVPQNAQKKIGAGRLKGMTDINPMWRIRALTEMFGPCGIGWKYVITDKRIEVGADGVMCAFMDIDLFIKYGDEWSEAIPGTGGNLFVASERGGLHTNDECFKMALTDAISVACKALGFGADVYWSSGCSKYSEFPVVTNVPTYEDALVMQYNGKALKDIYHEDRKMIQTIYEAADTPAEIKSAIEVIEAKLDKMRKAQ